MADTQSQQKNNQQTYDDQSSYDQAFSQQMGSSLPQGLDVTSEVVRAYFDNIEQQTRTARRVSEVWATAMILNQSQSFIVAEVTKKVLRQLKSESSELNIK